MNVNENIWIERNEPTPREEYFEELLQPNPAIEILQNLLDELEEWETTGHAGRVESRRKLA